MVERNFLLQNLLIETPKLAREEKWFSALDRISKKYFSEDFINQDLKNLYIMHNYWRAIGTMEERNLGNVEADLLERIKNPIEPLLLLKGCLGSGKTTTCRFISDYITRSVGDLHFNDSIIKLPLIPNINCTRIYIPKNCDERQAEEILTDEIMYALDAAINDSKFRENIDNEIINFWDYGLSMNARNYHEYHVFNKINSELGPNINLIKARSELNAKLRNIFGHKEYLSYLFSLYGYFRHVICKNIPQATFLIIDNVDQLQIFAQRSLLDLISTNIRNLALDPLVLLTLRPEARMAKSMGTHFIDVLTQESPKPKSLLSQRIDLCLKNFNEIIEVTKDIGLNENDYKRMKQYFIRLLHILHIKNPFSEFITFSSNGSGRIALWLSNGIMNVGRNVLLSQSDTISLNNLIKACITQGLDYRKEAENHSHPTHNLFSIHDTTTISALLIQTRILLILHNSIKLTDLLDELENFGYDHQLMLNAINDLLEIPLQLIVSSGTEQYKNIDDLLNSPQDEIKRTLLGENYVQKVIKEPAYVQEMMFNSWVPGDRFHEGERDSSMLERFDLLYRFIYMLIDLDFNETKIYLYKVRGQIDYYAQLMNTSNLITYDILIQMIPSVVRIFKRVIDVKKKKANKLFLEEPDTKWVTKKNEFESIIDWARHKTDQCFNPQPYHL